MEQVSSAATAFTEDAAEGFAVLHRETRPALPRDLNPIQHPAPTESTAMTTITSTAPPSISANIWPNIIDGREVGGGGEEVLRDSPAHDVRVASYHSASEADVDAAVTLGQKAFSSGDWPRMSGANLTVCAASLRLGSKPNWDELALIETLESGKPISQAKDEVSSAADIWYYAASLAQHGYGDAHNDLGPNYLAVTVKEPIGVVGVITPWNFPLLIVSSEAAICTGSGLHGSCQAQRSHAWHHQARVVQILHDEGLPNGVVNLVHGGGDVGGWLSSHPGTHMTTFTGSTGVGRMVAQAAAKDLKKVSLELGGKNPQVVFPDADLDAALEKVVFGAYFNQGECCNAGSRLLVHADIADDFTARIVERAQDVVVGDPLDPFTKVGALISREASWTGQRLC